MIARFATLFASLAVLFAVAPVAAKTDWNHRVVATAEGGWLVGNPKAPVKLVEYASYTCPHCAHFAADGWPALRRDYIASGKLSLELRQYALNSIDLTEGMLVRCAASPAAAFALGEKMFAQQQAILANPPTQEDAAKLEATPPARIHAELARIIKLDQWAAANGLAPARINACLSDLRLRDRIVAIRKTATETYNINGTPSFLLNGKPLDKTYDWAALEPQVKAVLAGK